jgi:adenosylhomocysteine nucleosidase
VLAIISAMFWELDLLKKGLINQNWQIYKKERINNRMLVFYSKNNEKLVLYTAGVGGKNSIENIERVLEKINLDTIIFVGLAGAINNQTKISDIILPRSIYNSENSKKIDCYILPNFPIIDKTREANILSTPRLCHLDDKKYLSSKFGDCLAIDMESFAIAQLCVEKNVRIMVCKSISDNVDFIFPDEKYIPIFFIRKNILYKFFYLLKMKINLYNFIRLFKLYKNSLKARKSYTELILKVIHNLCN